MGEFLENRENTLYDLVLGDVAAGRLSDLRAKYAAVQATHPVVLNMYRRLFEDSRQLAYRAKELI